MYMPNLIPRDVHHLWLQNDKSLKSSSSSQSYHNNRQQQQQLLDEESYQQQSSSSYAPPLSSYTSVRPGASVYTRPSSSHMLSESSGSDMIQSDIDEKLRQLRSIRTLGYSYLAPLGLGKTMETLREEAEMRRQMDEQFQTEATTAENLLGEADLEQQQQQQQQQGNQQNNQQSIELETNPIIPNPSVVQFATPEATRIGQFETSQFQQVHDLDDEISDAEENSYDNYNESDLEADGNTFERQYDRGFMVSEQYESQEVNDVPQQSYQTPQQQQHQHHQQQHHSLQHSGINTSSSFGNATRNHSSFNASGMIAESSFGEADANVSFNGSDLDMTID